jgi:hypothetical protein
MCAAAIIVLATPDDVRTMLYGLLIVVSASSAWALLQVTGVVSYDVWHLQISSLGRPTGFYPEPDWLGMYAGVGAVLAWRLELTARWRVALVTLNRSCVRTRGLGCDRRGDPLDGWSGAAAESKTHHLRSQHGRKKGTSRRYRSTHHGRRRRPVDHAGVRVRLGNAAVSHSCRRRQ